MRKHILILLITNGLVLTALGQTYVPMHFTQPSVLAAVAGTDTLVCNGHPVVLGGTPTASGGSNSYVYMWSPPDGLNDPTSSNPIATLTETKTYMLSVTDAQGCQAVSFITVHIDACLGVESRNLNAALTVFPNPSNGRFTLQGMDTFNGHLESIQVYDQLGQIVFHRGFQKGETVSDLEIDTRIQEPGIYFLKVTMTDRMVSERLVVR